MSDQRFFSQNNWRRQPRASTALLCRWFILRTLGIVLEHLGDNTRVLKSCRVHSWSFYWSFNQGRSCKKASRTLGHLAFEPTLEPKTSSISGLYLVLFIINVIIISTVCVYLALCECIRLFFPLVYSYLHAGQNL